MRKLILMILLVAACSANPAQPDPTPLTTSDEALELEELVFDLATRKHTLSTGEEVELVWLGRTRLGPFVDVGFRFSKLRQPNEYTDGLGEFLVYGRYVKVERLWEDTTKLPQIRMTLDGRTTHLTPPAPIWENVAEINLLSVDAKDALWPALTSVMRCVTLGLAEDVTFKGEVNRKSGIFTVESSDSSFLIYERVPEHLLPEGMSGNEVSEFLEERRKRAFENREARQCLAMIIHDLGVQEIEFEVVPNQEFLNTLTLRGRFPREEYFRSDFVDLIPAATHLRFVQALVFTNLEEDRFAKSVDVYQVLLENWSILQTCPDSVVFTLSESGFAEFKEDSCFKDSLQSIKFPSYAEVRKVYIAGGLRR